jgi:hypothetical protein
MEDGRRTRALVRDRLRDTDTDTVDALLSCGQTYPDTPGTVG